MAVDPDLTATLVSYTPGYLQRGPVLGDVGPDYIYVWASIWQVGETFIVEYWPYGSGPPGTQVVSEQVAGSNWNSAHVKLTGLTPKTRYGYRITVNGVNYGPWEFVTAPADKDTDFELFFSSDAHSGINEYNCRGFLKVLNDRELDPTKFRAFFSYGDMLQLERPSSIPTFQLFHDMAVLDPLDSSHFIDYDTNYFAHFLRYVPWYNMWDDWDFQGDNSWKESRNYGGRDVMRELWTRVWSYPTHDADNGGGLNFYKIFGNVLVIVMDGQFNKEYVPHSYNPKIYPTGFDFNTIWDQLLDQKCWGDQQTTWFRRIVSENQDNVEFLIMINGTTMVDITSYVADNTQNVSSLGARHGIGFYHKKEKNKLLKWIDECTKFKDLIVFTGDDHINIHWEYNQIDDRENLNVFDENNYVQFGEDPDEKMFSKWHTFSKLLIHEFKTRLGGGGAQLGSPSKMKYTDQPQGDANDDVAFKVRGSNANKFIKYAVAGPDGLYRLQVKGRVPSQIDLELNTHTTNVYPATVNYAKTIKATPTVEDPDANPGTSYTITDGVYPAPWFSDDFEDGSLDWDFTSGSVSIVNIPVGIGGAEGLKCLSVGALFGGAAAAQKFINVSNPAVLSWRTLIYTAGSPWVGGNLKLYDPDSIVYVIKSFSTVLGAFAEYVGTFNLTKIGQWKLEYFCQSSGFGSANLYVDLFEGTLISPYTEYT